MGRKRRLPARAREKLVGEEVATAMEVEQKESALQAKPDDALFVVDAVGEMELETEAESAACSWSTSHVHHISVVGFVVW